MAGAKLPPWLQLSFLLIRVRNSFLPIFTCQSIRHSVTRQRQWSSPFRASGRTACGADDSYQTKKCFGKVVMKLPNTSVVFSCWTQSRSVTGARNINCASIFSDYLLTRLGHYPPDDGCYGLCRLICNFDRAESHHCIQRK